jgi:hypothetical protein
MGTRLLHRLSQRACALRGRILEGSELAGGAEALRAGLKRLAAAGAALLLAGCIPSLHPFYTEKDLAFDARLLGTWSPQGEKETWAFSAHEPTAYRLVYTDDKGRAGRFKVRLLRLQGHSFLDLHPEEAAPEQNDYYRLHLVRAHSFLHVRKLEPTLVFTAMNPSWLEKHLKANPGAIAHERLAGGIVLTADTAALQVFVLAHLETKDAFGKPAELIRQGGS